jgi:hypothetical protein
MMRQFVNGVSPSREDSFLLGSSRRLTAAVTAPIPAPMNGLVSRPLGRFQAA